MPGTIRIGVGGWTFEPWRGVFYPSDLPHKRELEYASRALTSIEINGTYYSTFKPPTWQSWNAQTPQGFVFSVKASRYVTNRRVLADAGPSLARFMAQGFTALGPKLGPINWQFMPSKKFDPDDFEAFLDLLPKSQDGLKLRHAIEVRHASFDTPQFHRLARTYGAAIVIDDGEDYPRIEAETADFTYVRYMRTHADAEAGLTPKEVTALAARARAWAKSGDVYLYIISGEKALNPGAAQALIARLVKP